MKKISIIFIALLISGLTSCSLLHGALQFNYKKFLEKKEAWLQEGIQNYTYEYYSVGFTYEHVRVIVENGEYLSSVPLTSPDGFYESAIPVYEMSLTDIYNDLEEFYLSEKNAVHLDFEYYLTAINIIYNEERPIPASVSYEYHIPQGLAVDGNFGFQIINFSLN